MKKLLLLISAAFIINCLSGQYNISYYNAACFGLCNGYAEVSPYHANYQYMWEDGHPYSADSALCAGFHYCIVRDSAGNYLDSLSCTITQPGPLAAATSITNASCTGNPDGAIVVTVAGGVPPYSFQWSNGSNVQNMLNIPAGTYTITVVDSHGCTATAMGTVLQAGPPISLAVTTIDAVPCGANNGLGTATVIGGTPPFSYLWSDNSTGSIDPAMGSGIYSVIVTDSFGCSAIAFASAAMQIDSNIMDYPTCDHPDTGAIGIYVFGGNPPYSYLWNTGDTITLLQNLSAGNYSVTVTDGSGCQAVRTFNLFRITADINYYAYINVTPANCSNNGTATVTPYGGYPPYYYLWNSNPPQTTQTAFNLGYGSYRVSVTDSLGCVANGTVTIPSQCATTISGTLFVDTNGNCQLDPGEAKLNGYYVTITGHGVTNYATSNNSGYYSIAITDTGTYTITTSNYYVGYCSGTSPCGTGTLLVTVDTLGISLPNNNLAFTTTTGAFDLTDHPGWTTASPGFQKEYWLMPFNASNITFTGQATVVFAYDSNLTYQFSYNPQPVHDPVAHTLTWVVSNVPYPSFDWNNYRFENFFLVPASLNPGYMLQSDFYITPTTGDCNPGNNHMHFSELVTGSHDPNEKTVEPAGAITEADSVLTYTIHFQNDGTAAAQFIIVKDTLSPYLDPASVHNLAASHLITSFDISGNGILTWVINPANLPDSLVDVEGSKGFITFSVQQKKNLAIGVSINNTASIYFDYNEPVATNTVRDTISTQIVTRIQQLKGAEINANIYPNPANSLLYNNVEGAQPTALFIYDVNGQKLLEEKYTQTLDINRLSAGIYFIEIKADTGSVRKRFVKM